MVRKPSAARFPPGALCPLLHDCPHGVDIIGASPDRDDPVAEFPRDPHRLWPKGGNVDRNRAIEIHDPALGVQEPDRSYDVAFAVRDRLAVQQPLDSLDIVPEGTNLHRGEAHRAPAGVPRANAQDNAPWVELVQRRNGVGRNRGTARRRDGDPRPDVHPSCTLRAEGHDDIHVGVNHVGVEEPC